MIAAPEGDTTALRRDAPMQPSAKPASGFQIAFLTFAVLLLVVPLNRQLAAVLALPPDAQTVLGRALPFFIALAILFGFPRIRERCRALLSVPVPREKRVEVAIVALGNIVVAVAVVGAWVVWHWATSGMEGVQRFHASWAGWAGPVAPFGLADIALSLVLFVFLGPLVEEIVFRGMLYPAWERRFGWIVSMLLTALLFAAYHSGFLSQVLSSILFVCLLRRTGSLRAPIIVHACGNLALWHPLLGTRLVPDAGAATTSLAGWWFHLACLLVVAVAVPAYVWRARRPRESVAVVEPEPDAPLPR